MPIVSKASTTLASQTSSSTKRVSRRPAHEAAEKATVITRSSTQHRSIRHMVTTLSTATMEGVQDI